MSIAATSSDWAIASAVTRARRRVLARIHSLEQTGQFTSLLYTFDAQWRIVATGLRSSVTDQIEVHDCTFSPPKRINKI
jgi:hypothetical protein